MTPLKIFICYKKVLTQEKNGKTIEYRDSKAEILHFLLSQANGEFEPWMDVAELAAGMTWEAEIYKRILDSDVVIVLAGLGTSQSEWVKREIALANALGITVVPIGFDLTQDELATELKGLGIERFQGRVTGNIKLNAGKALLSEMRGDLLSAADRTRQQQQITLQALLGRRNIRPAKAPDRQRAAAFKLVVDDHSIELCVASGDISKVRDIDVLVNSENDYMQMARFFESRTVSSVLRRLGASIQNGKYEDTIQSELDFQLQGRGRPVQASEVVVTSAGGPTSDLARLLKARYILHVAAVQAVVAEATVIPYQQSYQIESCVRNCLSKLIEISKNGGVVSPPGTLQRGEQETLASSGIFNIRSILFPLFGTGRGGIKTADVIGPMLSSIQEFFNDAEGRALAKTLDQIYISVFTTEDVQQVTDFLQTQIGNQVS